MFQHKRRRTLLFTLLLVVVASVGATPFEVGLSAGGGLALWMGAWSDVESGFSKDFGQKVSPLAAPSATFSLDASFREYPWFEWGPFLGGGLWGGRMLSSGGAAPERISSIEAWTVEVGASAGLRAPFYRGIASADLRGGLGFAVVPLAIRNEWPAATTLQQLEVPPSRAIFPFLGLSLGQSFSLGPLYRLRGTLGADLGFANFEDSSTLSLLTRVDLALRLSRSFQSVGGAR